MSTVLNNKESAVYLGHDEDRLRARRGKFNWTAALVWSAAMVLWLGFFALLGASI